MPETDAEEAARLHREADAYDRAMRSLPLDPPTGDPEAEQAHWRQRFERLDELVRADLGYVPRKITARERITDGSGLRLYRSTPEDIVRWARESRPPVNAADVVAKVRQLREAGIMTADDEAEIERLLPEVGHAVIGPAVSGQATEPDRPFRVGEVEATAQGVMAWAALTFPPPTVEETATLIRLLRRRGLTTTSST